MNSMVLPLWAWIVFYVLVFIMLIADLKMFGKKGQHEVKVGEALKMTAVWIGVSLLFCVGIYAFYPVDSHEMALEFLAGYLIEKSLSMDNLFVFLMLFSFFGIERKYQHEVLFWGIFGALVLRSIFIFAGAAMVERFEWVLGIFGIFLPSFSRYPARRGRLSASFKDAMMMLATPVFRRILSNLP